MKNREAFSIFRKRLEPRFRERGFAAANDPHHRAAWGWTRPEGSRHLNVWWQADKYPFDLFSGSKFVVEFERSCETKPGYSDFHDDRRRLNRLLSDEDRVVMLGLQNSVIARLKMPTDEEYAAVYGFPPFHPLIDDKFTSVRKPYGPTEDVWLRFHTANDLGIWADFIDERIDRIFVRLEQQLNEKQSTEGDSAAI
jgi:hypothetical protein